MMSAPQAGGLAEDRYRIVPFTMDEGLMARAAIGLVVLATDQTLEYEWRSIMQLSGVAFFEARLHNSPDITPESLALMEQDIRAAVALIVPGLPLAVVAFGCTSGTIVIGEEQVFARIREARPDVACTTPITGAVAGLRRLGAARIGLVTPYVRSINQIFADHIEAAGIAVNRVVTFNHANDPEVARIDRASLRAAVLEAGRHDDVDAVFVSCTSLRMAECTAGFESELGKPIVSSNSAMAWHALRLAGIDDAQPQFGRLFTL
ncbi:maleate cis-trans isomerase family protein [Bordetella sp. 2513F-2]